MNKYEQDLVKDLLLQDEGLDEWSISFLDNLSSNYQEEELSDKQRNVLEKLAKRFKLIS